jgi:hypothetical protein
MNYATPELVIIGAAKGLILGTPPPADFPDPDEVTYRDEP